MATQLYLLELLPQSSAHAVSDTLGLGFILAVTKRAQSPTIEEMEMTAIRVNNNVLHILLKRSLSAQTFPLNNVIMPYVYFFIMIDYRRFVHFIAC